MEKNIEYYMRLPYTMVVGIEEDNAGNCYVARLQEIPYLIGTGSTFVEAIKELAINNRLKFETDLELGVPIPEPSKYSGQFHLRVGVSLHESLAQLAALEDISLNQYITNILARAVGSAQCELPRKRKLVASSKK